MFDTLPPDRIRLDANWQVYPVPLDSHGVPTPDAAQSIRTVPACAHLQPVLFPNQPYWGPQVRAINDRAWIYRQVFTAPPGPYRRARLRFEGADYYAAVWLNDVVLGEHEGHFAPFGFDVSAVWRPGAANTLTVRLSAPWDPPHPGGMYPIDHVLRGLVKGLYEHGEGVIPPDVNPIGLWRPVWLLLDDGMSIDEIQVRAGAAGRVEARITTGNARPDTWRGQLEIAAEAENHAGPGARTALPLTLPPGTHTLDAELRIPTPQLWWPWDHGRPDLYRLTARLTRAGGHTVSQHSTTFGLREVELERSPERFVYRLNGRPVFVRGSSYMPGLYLSQCSVNTLARDLNLARDAHLNLLRVHVHVSPPEFYDLCDRAGMLVWQDSELNWVHDPSPAFETRALRAQADMLRLLGSHPCIITWACHNEPTMVFTRRHNLERHPDPALYADACRRDPTRPVFICSGQMESDWRRAGDAHTYYGAIWSRRYTDIYPHRFRLNTEFGFEAPAAAETLRSQPVVWERLSHVEDQIPALWDYQAELVQYQVEHLRRLRASGCAGYIHFWLVDVVPQVGCGVLDARRIPKGGYAALERASQALLPALEHDGRRPIALWIFNDTINSYAGAVLAWRILGLDGGILLEGDAPLDVAPNQSMRVMEVDWRLTPAACARIELSLRAADGGLLASNRYQHSFTPPARPRGYPWKFDPLLGTKVFDRPSAPSLADLGVGRPLRGVPLPVREHAAEWVLRQRLPTWLLSALARLIDRLK